MARSTARKRALNTLYEADEKGQDILSLLAERIEHPGAETPLPEYAIELVRGVAAEASGIDNALNEHSTKWSVRRMAVIDRNILRIAVWEILFNDEVPDKVAIDEALGLAKDYSDDDTPSFIHGLLSTISTKKTEILAQIAQTKEQDRQRREQREAEERRKNSPTAPGFLTSGGVSGQGKDRATNDDCLSDDIGGEIDGQNGVDDQVSAVEATVGLQTGQIGNVSIQPTASEDGSVPDNSTIGEEVSDRSDTDDSVTETSSFG
jgi:transcription antitermination protein NusB